MSMRETLNGIKDSAPAHSRLERLIRFLDSSEIDALLVSTDSNRRYLSGFTGSAGSLVVSQSNCVLITDGRYTAQAIQESPQCEVITHSGPILEQVASTVVELGIGRLGFDPSTMSVKDFADLGDRVGERCTLIAAPGLVEKLRIIKDPLEIDCMRRAIKIADQVHEMVAHELEVGKSERQLAMQIEQEFRELGAEKPSFDVIVAAGRNSAMPPHRPGNSVVKDGEAVVVDFGVIGDGYCSDITRTYCAGARTEQFDEVYGIVLEAEHVALETVSAGQSAREVDRAAREIIESAGYGDFFQHGVGHGVGMEIHEAPRLAASSNDKLEAGMVHSIEPGIYLPKWGGVRIEDLVLVQEGGMEILTSAPK